MYTPFSAGAKKTRVSIPRVKSKACSLVICIEILNIILIAYKVAAR